MSKARAGWSTRDITPKPGVPLGGRGPQFTGVDEILDPLSAQAVALEDRAGRTVLFVSLDLVGIGTAMSLEIRHTLAAWTGVPFESIVLNFSHTHSGPMTIMDKYPVIGDAPDQLIEYEESLEQAILAVALDAVENLHPVTISRFEGETGIGMNRRMPDESGEIRMNPNPDGFIVRDLWGLDIRGETDDSDRCILFSAACHAVTVYSWKWSGCSADFPGAARNAITSELGGCVHAQFLQGFAGNVRPARLADLSSGKFRKSIGDDHIEIGRELAANVIAATAETSRELLLTVNCSAGYFRAWSNPEASRSIEHWQRMTESESEVERNFGAYWLEEIKAERPFARCVPWDIGIIELGADLRLVWMAGEVCGEWLPLLRGWLDTPDLRGVGYCQDLPSYLPTAALIEEGGYEVIRSRWYRKTGPAPFDRSIEGEARRTIERLRRCMR